MVGVMRLENKEKSRIPRKAPGQGRKQLLPWGLQQGLSFVEP